jgi:hypothetical protein
MALTMSAAMSYAYNLPTMNAGDTYTVSEKFNLLSPQLGENPTTHVPGYATVTGTATYTVAGNETVTQEKTGNTFDCIKLTGAGTGAMDGEVFNAGGFITGAVRFQPGTGTYTATIWINASDFATVKKNRVISGTIAYKAGPVWLELGALSIDENEEYDAPLQDVKFPMTPNATWNQSLTIHAFGTLVVPILGNSDFSQELALEGSAAVAAANATVNGCDSLNTTMTASNSPVTVSSDYCCASNWVSKYKITNLPLGDTGTLEYVQADITSYNVAGDSCGGGGSAGVELTANNGGNYNANDAVDLAFHYWNTTGTDYAGSSLWIFCNILGNWYTVPNFNDQFGPYSSFSLTNGADVTTSFVTLTWPGVGATVPIDWYAGLLDGSFGFVAGSSPAVLNTTFH